MNLVVLLARAEVPVHVRPVQKGQGGQAAALKVFGVTVTAPRRYRGGGRVSVGFTSGAAA